MPEGGRGIRLPPNATKGQAPSLAALRQNQHAPPKSKWAPASSLSSLQRRALSSSPHTSHRCRGHGPQGSIITTKRPEQEASSQGAKQGHQVTPQKSGGPPSSSDPPSARAQARLRGTNARPPP
ncbi:hypothetical protein NDU88_006690 [Pleurodeles waltl]|uniref:Uncharacterized protein n=1 Tax=Pleurodeles waltl TaxID=8319 RepID=A0AAV7QJH2_PLEWA|nr:hypothetical protein NDU88_006690 [Pleurodeles waltl]